MIIICSVCRIYTYDEKNGDPETGLKPGTTLRDIPDTWRCPVCGARRESLRPVEDGEIRSGNGTFSLVEVRNNAREKLAGICGVYNVCDGRPDRLCMGQKYGQPIGLGGAGKGLGFSANVESLDRVKLKTRLISPHIEPDTRTAIYGHHISIPVMPSSLSGSKNSMGDSISEKEFAFAILQGALDAGSIGFIGNTADPGEELTGVETVQKVGRGIPIFKPQKNERLLTLIRAAEDAGAVAVGIDLDGVASDNWARKGRPLYRKSVPELRELADSTELPFIAKGIMSVEDALDSLDAGVSGIDVSNHGGRVLDSTRGVAEILPGIRQAVNKRITVTAGGGVRTGFDVLKMLALGADAVLIGRDMVRAALGGGPAGVRLHFEYIRGQLRQGMIMTSCNTIDEIDEKVIDRADRG